MSADMRLGKKKKFGVSVGPNASQVIVILKQPFQAQIQMIKICGNSSAAVTDSCDQLKQVQAFICKRFIVFITKFQGKVEPVFQLFFKLAKTECFIYRVFDEHLFRKARFLECIKGIGQ